MAYRHCDGRGRWPTPIRHTLARAAESFESVAPTQVTAELLGAGAARLRRRRRAAHVSLRDRPGRPRRRSRRPRREAMVLRSAEAWTSSSARGRRAPLVVGYTFQFTRLAEACPAGRSRRREIGDLLLVSGLFASMAQSYYSSRPQDYADVFKFPLTGPKPDTYSDPAISGGGQGQTQITHAMGMVLWATGARAVEVHAKMADAGPDGRPRRRDLVHPRQRRDRNDGPRPAASSRGRGSSSSSATTARAVRPAGAPCRTLTVQRDGNRRPRSPRRCRATRSTRPMQPPAASSTSSVAWARTGRRRSRRRDRGVLEAAYRKRARPPADRVGEPEAPAWTCPTKGVMVARKRYRNRIQEGRPSP